MVKFLQIFQSFIKYLKLSLKRDIKVRSHVAVFFSEFAIISLYVLGVIDNDLYELYK